MALAVVLARKGLAADGTHKGPFVGVGAQVGAEVVGAGEAFGAEGALEGGRVFLDAAGVFGPARGGAGGVGEVEEVFAVRVDGGCGGAAQCSGAGGGAARAGLVGPVEWREGAVAVVWVDGESG